MKKINKQINYECGCFILIFEDKTGKITSCQMCEEKQVHDLLECAVNGELNAKITLPEQNGTAIAHGGVAIGNISKSEILKKEVIDENSTSKR